VEKKRSVGIIINVVLIILILFMLGRLLYPMIIGPRYIIRRFTPNSNSTIAGVEEKIGSHLTINECKIHNQIYKIGAGPFIEGKAVSGPPMYVFNSDGVLIDYTLDVGDDPAFREKWGSCLIGNK
jgi:hypothetical protein